MNIPFTKVCLTRMLISIKNEADLKTIPTKLWQEALALIKVSSLILTTLRQTQDVKMAQKHIIVRASHSSVKF